MSKTERVLLARLEDHLTDQAALMQRVIESAELLTGGLKLLHPKAYRDGAVARDAEGRSATETFQEVMHRAKEMYAELDESEAKFAKISWEIAQVKKAGATLGVRGDGGNDSKDVIQAKL